MTNRIIEEPEYEPVARCTIPQDVIKDPEFIAAPISQKRIEQAIRFKRAALQGMVELKHIQYIAYIQDQIKVLQSALAIQSDEHPL